MGTSRTSTPGVGTTRRRAYTTYRARYYSAAIGRFLQTDPVGYKDDTNLYAYVGNDPTDRTDPSGLTGTNSSQGGCNDTSAMCVSIKMPGNISDAGSNGDQQTTIKDKMEGAVVYSEKTTATPTEAEVMVFVIENRSLSGDKQYVDKGKNVNVVNVINHTDTF